MGLRRHRQTARLHEIGEQPRALLAGPKELSSIQLRHLNILLQNQWHSRQLPVHRSRARKDFTWTGQRHSRTKYGHSTSVKLRPRAHGKLRREPEHAVNEPPNAIVPTTRTKQQECPSTESKPQFDTHGVAVQRRKSRPSKPRRHPTPHPPSSSPPKHILRRRRRKSQLAQLLVSRTQHPPRPRHHPRKP
jgi:hypothetical protein